MKLKIISQEGLFLEEDGVASVTLPAEGGMVTVLPGHASLLCRLMSGEAIYKGKNGQAKTVEVQPGILRVEHDLVEALLD